jgi:hypothetical protein
MNPDADTTRIVRAEQFEREVARLLARGLERGTAELQVALEHPHLACAVEQLRHPAELHAEIARRFLGG